MNAVTRNMAETIRWQEQRISDLEKQIKDLTEKVDVLTAIADAAQAEVVEQALELCRRPAQ